MNPFTRSLDLLLRFYQLTFSALLGRQCRFLPTCSEYARDAIAAHGALRGGLLALRRVLRCHPWSASGYDPVPPRASLHSGHRCKTTTGT
jgi:putative membrane protein insertion efficiency factor